MGDAAAQVESAGAAPVDADRPPTLRDLADSVEMTDVDASQAAHAAITPSAGRLRDLAEWRSGTEGRWPASAPTRPRLVCRGPVSAAAAAVAESMAVGIDELATPDGAGVAAAAAHGIAAADAQVDAGTDLLVLAEPGSGAGIGPAVLVSVVTDTEPIALLPRGAAAIDTEEWIARAVALRDLRRRVRTERDDPDALLDALGDPALATTCGFLFRAIARRTAVVLDGTGPVAAAVLCLHARERAGRWLRVADSSPDPVHRRGMGYLDQRPLLDLETQRGDGLAGLLVVSLLRAAVEIGRGDGTEGPS